MFVYISLYLFLAFVWSSGRAVSLFGHKPSWKSEKSWTQQRKKKNKNNNSSNSGNTKR